MLKLYDVTYMDERTGKSKQVRVPAYQYSQVLDGIHPLYRNKVTEAKEVKGFDFWLTMNTSKPLKASLMVYEIISPLLKAGVPIVPALCVLARRCKSPLQKAVVMDMAQIIQSGGSVPSAFKKYSKIFPVSEMALVEAGDRTGQLATTITTLEGEARKGDKLFKKVRGSLIYPAVVLTAAYGIILFFALKLIPQLEDVYSQLGADLPWSTKKLVLVSHIMVAAPYLAIIPPGIVAFLYAIKGKLANTGIVKWLSLKIPVLSVFLRKLALAKALRTLTITDSAGVPLVEGLRLAAASTGIPYYITVFERIGLDIEKGMPVVAAFQYHAYAFSDEGDRVCTTVEVGEQSGGLATAVGQLASIYEEELDIATEALQKLIEPIMLAILACVVGFLVFAMYYPIFSLGKHFMESM